MLHTSLHSAYCDTVHTENPSEAQTHTTFIIFQYLFVQSVAGSVSLPLSSSVPPGCFPLPRHLSLIPTDSSDPRDSFSIASSSRGALRPSLPW